MTDDTAALRRAVKRTVGATPSWLFLLATTGDRPGPLRRCLESIREYFGAGRVVLLGQRVPELVQRMVTTEHRDLLHACTWWPQPLGPHAAKYQGLRMANPDAWVSIDDDMEFSQTTNLAPALEKALEPGVGFVTAGWVRSLDGMKKRTMRHRFVPRALVFTGGGMCFSRAVRDLILERTAPSAPMLCDNTEWSLTAYTAGLQNYYYQGSLTVHRTVGRGGRRAWLQETAAEGWPADLVRARPCTRVYAISGNNYHTPDDSDLTPKARRLHRQNRAMVPREHTGVRDDRGERKPVAGAAAFSPQTVADAMEAHAKEVDQEQEE